MVGRITPGALTRRPTSGVDQGRLAGAGRAADHGQQRGVDAGQPGQYIVVQLLDDFPGGGQPLGGTGQRQRQGDRGERGPGFGQRLDQRRVRAAHAPPTVDPVGPTGSALRRLPVRVDLGVLGSSLPQGCESGDRHATARRREGARRRVVAADAGRPRVASRARSGRGRGPTSEAGVAARPTGATTASAAGRPDLGQQRLLPVQPGLVDQPAGHRVAQVGQLGGRPLQPDRGQEVDGPRKIACHNALHRVRSRDSFAGSSAGSQPTRT